MASRLDFSRLSAEVPRVVEETEPKLTPLVRQPVQPVVTPSMVNAAVESVFEGTVLSDENKVLLKKIMSVDDSTDFAHSLHVSELKPVTSYPRLSKRKVYCSYVLDQDETADVVGYALEYELVFTDVDSHDHAVAAALRILDTEILMDFLPYGVPFKDIGGRPLFHICKGSINGHICNPHADGKDPSRQSTRRLSAKRIAQRTDDDVVATLAHRYLSGDESFVCTNLGQDCRHKAAITISCHVYDVAIQEWPSIMASAGASIHFGAMSFPLAALDQSSGELPMLRARYEVDLQADTYSMGFKNSPSLWYTHKWSDYMRYASDQEIVCQGVRYSYKVIERRGDTIFFRIMKVDGIVPDNFVQHYQVPSVQMVNVTGFSYDMTSSTRLKIGGKISAVSSQVLFPARLWKDMLSEAMLRFEKGDFSYDKMYNYYRTVSARHTINGVLVSGGQKVGMQQVVDLIVRSGFCAASKVMLEQRTSRAITGFAMSEREWFGSSNLGKMLKLFVSAVKTAAGALVYYPLVWLCDKLSDKFSSYAVDELASWEFEPEIKEYPFSSVVTSDVRSKFFSWVPDVDSVVTDFSSGKLTENMAADHDRLISTHPDIARLVLETIGLELPEAKREQTQQSAFTMSDAFGKASETLVPEAQVDESDRIMRVNAIQERLDEGQLETAKISGHCEKIMRTVISGDKPNISLLRQRGEEYDSPDIWYVSNGVLQKSALGVKGEDCRHSAVFTLTQHAGSNFRVVRDEFTENETFRVLTSNYTGWALTTDRLLIFNGPEIEAALRKAMTLSHDYVVELQQGPPGCGKTHSMIHSMRHSHVAMCPVRESAGDTRDKLGELDPTFPDLRHRVSTVHSYLCNYATSAKSTLQADVLQADEVYMTHAAEWYAAAALLGVGRVKAYGDINQIPHVPRVQASKQHIRIVPQFVVEKFEDYRNPPSALAAWGYIYNWKVRSFSKKKTPARVATSIDSLPVPDGCVFLCMYQADKKHIKSQYATLIKQKRVKVMTVHESEGKGFDHVWLFRFDTRPRTDGGSLYDKEQYCLVAMSRHKDSFVYVRPRVMGDVIEKWIGRSNDSRALAAMADVATIGIPMQFK